MVRPVSGKAGVTSTIASPESARSASITGPILPASVESKVEQILNSTWPAPRPRSHFSAARERSTATPASIERLLSDTTTASTSGSARESEGTPIVCTRDRHREIVRGNANRLHRAQALAGQRIGEIGGAGVVVGDAAQRQFHGFTPA